MRIFSLLYCLIKKYYICAYHNNNLNVQCCTDVVQIIEKMKLTKAEILFI